ncbi:aldo/keto reductase [Chitinophaga deserti]|uniref:aldo/keto reductase n=1 Tax=Chitinophaga deserti TaxID=2164099 RepID=UPI000D6C1B16|nr:aldo/keto reductase [Chitinophaga deserti]
MDKTQLPEWIYGTSGLGNLYVAMPEGIKMEIIAACAQHAPGPLVFDTAGKYGAGLALEVLGKGLQQAGVHPGDVIISNKLGWFRTALTTPEPTFERDVWKELQHDAVQRISYDGILACYEQGNELLGNYRANWVSVHDPDEYLAAAKSQTERASRFRDITGAYAALQQLKQEGKVTAIGIGAKDWTVIREICMAVELDWVMIANSMTIHSHPAGLIDFMNLLHARGIPIINAAVFNGGFLTGLDYYNYQPVSPQTHPRLYRWREKLYRVCETHNIRPDAACAAFGRRAPGVKSVALSSTSVQRIAKNAEMAKAIIPLAFWQALVTENLIDAGFAEAFLYE